jgi:hypothetical protein
MPNMAEQLNNLDTTNIQLKTLLIIDNLQIRNAHSYFPNADIIFTSLPPVGEMNIGQRRQRIADIHNLARQHPIDTEYVWLLEDDSVIPQDCIQKLASNRYDGIISGVQAGRHAYKIVGAWTITEDYYTTIPYEPTFYPQNVDATGLYCLLQPTQQYLETPFEHIPDSPVGPDVHYTRQFNCKIDWTLPIGHQTQTETIWPDENCIVASFAVES